MRLYKAWHHLSSKVARGRFNEALIEPTLEVGMLDGKVYTNDILTYELECSRKAEKTV